VVDLKGKMMPPAFTDSHIHAPGNTLINLYQIDLNGIHTKPKTMKAIATFVAAHPETDL
jgi:predicted amidohydrolase YtcJ